MEKRREQWGRYATRLGSIGPLVRPSFVSYRGTRMSGTCARAALVTRKCKRHVRTYSFYARFRLRRIRNADNETAGESSSSARNRRVKKTNKRKLYNTKSRRVRFSVPSAADAMALFDATADEIHSQNACTENNRNTSDDKRFVRGLVSTLSTCRQARVFILSKWNPCRRFAWSTRTWCRPDVKCTTSPTGLWSDGSGNPRWRTARAIFENGLGRVVERPWWTCRFVCRTLLT